MVVVTGATGTIGTLLVRMLLSRGIGTRIMARDPAKARSLFGEDAAVVPGDFTNSASLERAFDRANAVFVLCSPAQAIPSSDAAALDAARRAGVPRVVKMSAIGVDAPASANLASSRWHAPGEAALRASGLAFTILRPAGFDSNALAWRAAILAGTPIEIVTGPGRHPFVDPRDVAEVAVQALTSDAPVNRTLTLTGPEAITARDQLDAIERVIGRSIASVDVSLETNAERLRSRGVPEEFVAMATAGQMFLRRGGSSSVFADLPQALGRAARTFALWAAEHAASFR